MIRFSMLVLSAIMVMAIWPTDNADARRFGGGSSFGSHQRSFSPSHTQRPSPAASRPATSRAAAGSNARPRSGWMGAIAGLAMGGLLGAMLFGGAFDGINMVDILLIGAIGFGLLWWFRRKAQQVASHQGTYAGSGQMGSNNNHSYIDTHAEPQAMAAGGGTDDRQTAKPQIDVGPFLDTSRTIFVRMQTAWDAQDIDDIRRFCLPEVVTHVEQQMEAQAGQRNVTEVATLQAELLDSWMESEREWAAVAFTAMVKEQTLAADDTLLETSDNRVQEVWTFCHDVHSDDPTWFVAGIAQQKN